MSDTDEGQRSVQRIRIVFQSGLWRVGTRRRLGGAEMRGDHAFVGGDMAG
jgi:hypothetical protein